MNLLEINRLNREEFATFGDILDTELSEKFLINNGNTIRFHDMAEIELLGGNSRPMVSIFRGSPHPLPIEIGMMERHPFGSQAFYPLQDISYLVVVATDMNGQPGPPKAFLATGKQGVNYRANVWHHPLLALKKTSDFLVIDRGGDGENLEEFFYEEPFRIDRI